MKTVTRKAVLSAATILLASTFITPAFAGEIALYDLLPAAGTSLAVTSTAAPFTASSLVLVNAANTASAFSNHFYHDNWSAGLDVGKYYTNTIGAGASSYTLDKATFSLENTHPHASNFTLRSSLDGFVSDIATGAFQQGNVTDFNVSLSGLGVLTGNTTFRWYMFGAGGTKGFANHEAGGAGGGLPDVGQDLRFFGSTVPDGGSSLTLLGLAVIGVVMLRRKLGIV